MRIFSEIYSTYYRITETILQRKTITKSEIAEIIRENGFSETMLFLEPKLTNDDGYGLLQKKDKIYHSILKKEPHVPLSILEKRWLVTILQNPKSNLFLDSEQKEKLVELLGCEKLYSQHAIHYFDQYTDGDDFENAEYIAHFRNILAAIHEQKQIKISFQTRRQNRITHYFLPIKMEYSAKNNKFRVLVKQYQKNKIVGNGIINLSQITLTEPTNRKADITHDISVKKKTAEIRISNERNAVNRFMMEFAELEKESDYDSETGQCFTKIKYNVQDETEIIIRLLGFGPVLEVVAPADFRKLMKKRIEKQYDLSNFKDSL